jgi:hypothetical protein
MSNSNPFDFPKSKIPVPESPYLSASRAGFLSDLSDQVFFDESIPTPVDPIGNTLDKPPYSYGPRAPIILHHDISVPNPGSSLRSRKRRDRRDQLPPPPPDYVEAKLEELLGPRSRLDSVLDDSVDDLLLQSIKQSRSLEEIEGRRHFPPQYPLGRTESPDPEEYIPFQRLSNRMDRKKSLSNSKINESLNLPRSPGPSRAERSGGSSSKRSKVTNKKDRPSSKSPPDNPVAGSSGNLITLVPNPINSTNPSPKKSPSKGSNNSQGTEKKSPSKAKLVAGDTKTSDLPVSKEKIVVMDSRKKEIETAVKAGTSGDVSPSKQKTNGGITKEEVAKSVATSLAKTGGGVTPAGGQTPAAGLSPTKAAPAGGSKRGSAKSSPKGSPAAAVAGVAAAAQPAFAGTDVVGADLNKLKENKKQELLRDTAAAFKLLSFCQKGDWGSAESQLKYFEKAIQAGTGETRPLAGIFDEVSLVKYLYLSVVTVSPMFIWKIWIHLRFRRQDGLR